MMTSWDYFSRPNRCTQWSGCCWGLISDILDRRERKEERLRARVILLSKEEIMEAIVVGVKLDYVPSYLTAIIQFGD